MIKYYFNPQDETLTVFNPETDSMLVMEPLKVRVMLADEARHAPNQNEDENGRAKRGGGIRKTRTTKPCRKCGEVGHRSDSALCPQNANADGQ